ncbi:MAG: cell division protein FtsK [Candidatus Rokuibacteriota bacterium]|nr:MAG: cell division protein FtsK [Candidatus Rokubacteria bacterium]
MAERVADRPAERGAERGPVPGTSARPDTAAARAARRARREQGRWVREVKGILALALAGFSGVALFAYEPTLHLLDQSSPVGPVGVWLGWIFFWAFGYAGFLFPLLLAGYGASAFIRSRMVTGWPAGLGLALLLISATGILTRMSDTLLEQRIHKGGVLGWAVSEALRASVGTVGAWIILLVLIPVAVLLITRISLHVMSGALGGWLRALAFGGAKAAGPAVRPAPGRIDPAVEPDEPAEPPRLVVKEPAKLKGSLVEKGGVNGHIVQASPGPVITSYEFEPAAGVKVSQVVNLSDDLALAMKAAAVRIIGPIPGRGTVAVEVPNPETATVYLREILVSPEFVESKGKLPLALGKDTTGNAVIADLQAMPHLLIAGSTGSGKSVGLNTMICSLLYKATPADVRLLLIDPKRLELGVYEGIPHLLAPVVTDAKEASARLKWIVGKMDERYKALQSKAVRNIEGYNKEVPPEEKLPYWVVVVDELADLMMVSAGDVQNSLVRLAQIARAVGIHLIVATQRPSVDVVTGLIKANFPTRIAFQVASKVDSRTVLDGNGAEQLLGRGDMIFVPPGASRQMRVHGSWVADNEVKAICDFLRKQGSAVYEKVELPVMGEESGGDGEDRDDVYWDAVNLVIAQRAASISFLQRRLGLGYPKAARFIDMMELDRIIGPGQGAKPREILVGPEYLSKRGK